MLIASIVAVSVVSDTTDAEAVWYDDFEEKPEVPTNPTSGYVCKVGDQNYSDFSAAYKAAIETGKELVLLDDFTIEKMEVVSKLVIDLNQHTLAFDTVATGTSEDGASVANLTIKNGTLYGQTLYNENGKEDCTRGSISVYSGCTVELSNVRYYTEATALYVCGPGATANVVGGSVIHAIGFCIGTNALTSEHYGVIINVSGSSLYADKAIDGAQAAILFNVPGNLNITDSTIQGYCQGVIVRGGTAVIQGSEIVNTMVDQSFVFPLADDANWGSGNNLPNGGLVIGNKSSPSSYQYPSDVSLVDTKITCNGDKASYSPAIYAYSNESEGNGIELVYDDCVFTNSAGSDNIVLANEESGNIVAGTPVAKIGDRDYASLQSAIEAALEGDTITLVDNCEFGSMVISKGITLDLNEKKITVNIPDSAVYGFFFRSGDSTIKNGTIEDVTSDGNTRGGLNTVIVSEVGTSLTVQDVNISAYEPDTTSLYNYIVRAQKGAELTLSGITTIEEKAQSEGKLDYETETYGTIGVAVNGSSDSSHPTTATVNKGVTVDVSGFAMSGNGSDTNTLITINGGSLTSENAQAIYHPQKGTLNINGGVITGVTGVEIRSGTLNMTGGEVHGANEGFDAEANSNGSTTSAVGIAIVQHTTGNDIDVNITGGTITGYRALTEANTQKNDEPIENISISLSGGKFIGAKDDTNSSVTAEDVESFIRGGTYVLADAVGNETADESLNDSKVMVDGFKVGETGSIILVSGETVATINGTPYGSLEKAIEAAESGDTIVLQVNIEIGSVLTIEESGITLDLGGNKITASQDFDQGSQSSFANLVNVEGVDGLTIKNGALVATAANQNVLNVYSSNGVVLEDLTLDNTANDQYTVPLNINGSNVTLSGKIVFKDDYAAVDMDIENNLPNNYDLGLKFDDNVVVDFDQCPMGIYNHIRDATDPVVFGDNVTYDHIAGFMFFCILGNDAHAGEPESLNESQRWVVTVEPEIDGSAASVVGSDGTEYESNADGTYYLPAGEFTVTASTAGYSGSKTMPLEGGVAGGSSTFSVEMSLNAPSVTITQGEQADDGSVTLSAIASHEIGVTYTYQWSDANGEIQGATAATYDAPGPGTYSVKVTASDGTKTSVAEAYATVSAPAPKYDVQIVVTPSDATVTIDGQTVTGTSVQLVAGTYQVVVSKDGYTSVTETIEVGEGLANRIEVHLEAVGPEDPDTPVYPPIFPGGDDDDVVIPPTVVVDQGSSDDDEAVKIVACAACAVVAAFLAAVMLFHRRD